MTVWFGNVHGGGLVPDDEARIAVRTAGVAYGLGCFETMRVEAGRVFLLDWHLKRLRAACERLGLDAPTPGLVEAGISALVVAVGLAGVGRLRLSVAAGVDGDTTMWATLDPLDDAPDGVRLVTVPWRRNADSPLAGVKALAYAETLLAHRAAQRAGGTDALLCNTDGLVAECATANVVVVLDGVACTPRVSDGALPGIGRRFLLADTAAGVLERGVPETRLAEAGEVFVVSALRGVRPVVGLDDRALPVGPITAVARRRWQERAADSSWWS